jgi:DNA-binding beta-propeller fold protein YncE
VGLIVSSLLAVTLAIAAPPKQAVPLTGPFQALAERTGTLLVADGVSGRIVRVDPRTGRRSVFAQRLGGAYDVEYGPGGVYATTRTRVVRFSGTRRQVIARGLQDPIGLAVASDGTVFVSESTANRVVRVDGRTHVRTVLASTGLDQPLGLALRSDGTLLVCDSHHGRVVAIHDDGVLEPVLEGLALPVSLTVAGDSVFVVDHVAHDRAGTILRLRPDGTTVVVSKGKIKAVSGVAVGRTGVLYALSFFPPFLGRLDAAGRLHPL